MAITPGTYNMKVQRRADQCIQRIKDNGEVSCIPFAPLNTDYKEYLEWVAEGNTPEEAS